MGHYVYLLRCADDTLYTGYTTDVQRRLTTHNAGKGAKYTRSRRPAILLASWEYATKGEALSAEYRLRHRSRAQKLLAAECPDAP